MVNARSQRSRTPAAVVAKSRRLGQPAPTRPNQVGAATALTYRWCPPSTWRDACSRRVVGRHLAAQLPTELVRPALELSALSAATRPPRKA